MVAAGADRLTWYTARGVRRGGGGDRDCVEFSSFVLLVCFFFLESWHPDQAPSASVPIPPHDCNFILCIVD